MSQNTTPRIVEESEIPITDPLTEKETFILVTYFDTTNLLQTAKVPKSQWPSVPKLKTLELLQKYKI